MLDLETCVDLEEIEVSGCVVDEVFDRTRTNLAKETAQSVRSFLGLCV